MKKLLSLILLFCLTSTISIANTEKTTPNFKDYCPNVYYHNDIAVRKADIENVIPRPIIVVGYIFAYVPGGILEFLNTKLKKDKAEEINDAIRYWKQREIFFNEEINKCQNNKKITTCYTKIIKNEEEHNKSISDNDLLNGRKLRLKDLYQNHPDYLL